MPWLIKGLLLALKTRVGRRILFAVTLGAFEVARSPRARRVYAWTWDAAGRLKR